MSEKKLPKAINEGILNIGGTELDVAVLDDGKRIITQTAVFKALDRPKRGNSRVINMPVFMDAQNLQPFVNEELKEVINKIEYKDLKGKKQEGFDAVILPLVSDLYLKARAAGAIKLPAQLQTAHKAEILVRSLAKVGIIALVDEATGYQYSREKTELQKILSAYIAEELLPWQKRFPDEFYTEIFRLNKWDYTVNGIQKRPGVIGTWTKKLIYNLLPNGVLEELEKKTPKSAAGNKTKRLFQSLTLDIGEPHLEKQLISVITLMNISDSWKEFLNNFGKKFKDKLIEIAQSSVNAKPSKIKASATQYLMFDEATDVQQDLFGNLQGLDRKGKLRAIMDSASKKEPLSDFNNKLNTALNFNPKK